MLLLMFCFNLAGKMYPLFQVCLFEYFSRSNYRFTRQNERRRKKRQTAGINRSKLLELFQRNKKARKARKISPIKTQWIHQQSVNEKNTWIWNAMNFLEMVIIIIIYNDCDGQITIKKRKEKNINIIHWSLKLQFIWNDPKWWWWWEWNFRL